MEKMKKLNLMMFFVGLLFCISCQDAELTLGEEGFDCGSSSKIVKKVKNQEGRLHYNTFLKRYAITVTEANTYDSKDVGLICTNTEHLTIPSKEEAISVVLDRKSTRLNSSHVKNSYAVFCLKKKINHALNLT